MQTSPAAIPRQEDAVSRQLELEELRRKLLLLIVKREQRKKTRLKVFPR